MSHHYLEPAKYAHPSLELTDRLDDALRGLGINPVRGTTWTIDTPYRETVEEARHYQQEGVLTVEMEAAALFAVARYRGVEIASTVTISDSLAELVWDPQFHATDTSASLERLFQAAVQALLPEPMRWRGHAGVNPGGYRMLDNGADDVLLVSSI